MQLSRADHSSSPPHINIPHPYNAAYDLLARHTSRTGKTAFIDALTGETLTFG